MLDFFEVVLISVVFVVPKSKNKGSKNVFFVYFFGCWMILGLLEAPFSWVGRGFWWKAFTASSGYAVSSDALAPETSTD